MSSIISSNISVPSSLYCTTGSCCPYPRSPIPFFNSSMLSIWSIHFWSTILSITTLSSSLKFSSPNSVSLEAYISCTFAINSSTKAFLSNFSAFNADTSLIPKFVSMSWAIDSLFTSSPSTMWESTINSTTESIIFSMLSFKFMPSKTSLLCS